MATMPHLRLWSSDRISGAKQKSRPTLQGLSAGRTFSPLDPLDLAAKALEDVACIDHLLIFFCPQAMYVKMHIHSRPDSYDPNRSGLLSHLEERELFE